MSAKSRPISAGTPYPPLPKEVADKNKQNTVSELGSNLLKNSAPQKAPPILASSPVNDHPQKTAEIVSKHLPQSETSLPGEAVKGSKGAPNMSVFWTSTVLNPTSPASKVNAAGGALLGEDILPAVVELIESVTELEKAIRSGNPKEVLKQCGATLLALSYLLGGSLFFIFRVLDSLTLDIRTKLAETFSAIATKLILPGEVCFEAFFALSALLNIDKLIGHFRFGKMLEKSDWFEKLEKEIQKTENSEKKPSFFDRFLNIRLEDCVGKANLESIKKASARGLSARLKSDIARVRVSAQLELAELKGRVQVENTQKKLISSAIVAINLLGIVVLALHFVACPPAALIILTTFLCAAAIGLSIYRMQAAWKVEAYNPSDKNWAIGYAVLTLLCFIGTLLVSHFGFQMNADALIAPCLSAIAALALYGFNYYKLHQREKQWKKEHLDLKTFRTYLDTTRTYQDIEKYFKNLPKADRKKIQENFNSPIDCYHELKYTVKRFSSTARSKAYQLRVKAAAKTEKSFRESGDIDLAKQMHALVQALRTCDESKFLIALKNIEQESKKDQMISLLNKNYGYVIKRQNLEELKQTVDRVLEPVSG